MEIRKEGRAKFYSYSGNPTKALPVFYNPEMENQRDITICALDAYQKINRKGLTVCDPLSGSGIRGIRILKEVECIKAVVFNDVNSEAVKLIKKNLKLNKINKKIKLYKKDARALLFENRSSFDFIDIDPFGSPIKYLEASAFAIKHKGFFAATATDTGALAGSFPRTCFRRYGVNVCRTDFYKELGIRVLITSIQKAFARYQAGFIPILSHSNHFFRVFGTIEKNRAAADRVLEKTSFVSYCRKCLVRVFEYEKICKSCKGRTEIIGPLWLGQIQDNIFVEKVLAEAKKRDFKIRFVEEENVPLYYDLSNVCGNYRLESIKIEKVIQRLKSLGFNASRSGLCHTGVKTDAPVEAIISTLQD